MRRLIAGCAVTVLVLAACGSDDSSGGGISLPDPEAAEALAGAADALGEVTSFRYDGTMSTRTTDPDGSETTQELTMFAEIDVASGALRMVTEAADGSSAGVAPLFMGDWILVGDSMYLSAEGYREMAESGLTDWFDEIPDDSDGLEGAPPVVPVVPDGILWFSMDMTDMEGEDDGNFEEEFAPFVSGGDPAEFFEGLGDIDGVDGAIETVGEEEVRGVATTRYRAIEDRSADEPKVVEVWIDGDGRPRKMTMSETYEYEPMGTQSSFIDVEFFDYGVELTIEAPPPEATMPWEDWLETWMGTYEDWAADQGLADGGGPGCFDDTGSGVDAATGELRPCSELRREERDRQDVGEAEDLETWQDGQS